MIEYVRIVSVDATKFPGGYQAVVHVNNEDGDPQDIRYFSALGDTIGIAQQVRTGIDEWVASGNPVGAAPVPPDPRTEMPSLTPRQIRLALGSIPITDAEIEAVIGDDQEALTEWRWAGQYERIHPLIVSLGPIFSLTPEQIDALWLWASDR